MSWTRFFRRTLPAAALAALFAAALPAAAAPDVGRQAPAFTGTDSNGKAVALAGYLGKTVILEWTNHDCPFVKRHYGLGNMQKLQEETTADGIVWLSMISSAPGLQGHVDGKQANALTKSRNAHPSRVILDPQGTIGRKYGAQTTPHMYIVDPKGTLRYMGAIDSEPTSWGDIAPATQNYVRLALADMKAGRTVAKPFTRAYGCTVKYAE